MKPIVLATSALVLVAALATSAGADVSWTDILDIYADIAAVKYAAA